LDDNYTPQHSCHLAFLIWRALNPFEGIKIIITDHLQMRDPRTRRLSWVVSVTRDRVGQPENAGAQEINYQFTLNWLSSSTACLNMLPICLQENCEGKCR